MVVENIDATGGSDSDTKVELTFTPSGGTVSYSFNAATSSAAEKFVREAFDKWYDETGHHFASGTKDDQLATWKAAVLWQQRRFIEAFVIASDDGDGEEDYDPLDEAEREHYGATSE
jgi:hypothetical protein